MKALSGLALATMAFSLVACVRVEPLKLSDDSPANAKAPSGFVSSPVALEEYKSPEAFASRAEEDAKTPAMDHSAHGGMNMPGMQQMPGMSMPAPPISSTNTAPKGDAGTPGEAAPHTHH